MFFVFFSIAILSFIIDYRLLHTIIDFINNFEIVISLIIDFIVVLIGFMGTCYILSLLSQSFQFINSIEPTYVFYVWEFILFTLPPYIMYLRYKGKINKS